MEIRAAFGVRRGSGLIEAKVTTAAGLCDTGRRMRPLYGAEFKLADVVEAGKMTMTTVRMTRIH